MDTMLTEPKVEYRGERHYTGIRTNATMRDLGTVIPQLLGEVCAWLAERGIEPAGGALIRYHAIDMESELDVEMGVPVATPLPGDGRVRPGVLPAGRYAALVYTGVENGVEANRALLEWGAREELLWDTYASPSGDGFGALRVLPDRPGRRAGHGEVGDGGRHPPRGRSHALTHLDQPCTSQNGGQAL